MIHGKNKILSWSISAALIVTIMLVCLWKASHPIDDPDLWWHLKSGEQIVSTGTLPTHDDFAYTSDYRETTADGLAIVRGYPVSEVTQYLLYSSMGNVGIILSRLLLCAAITGVILIRSRQMRADMPITLAVICAGLTGFLSAYSMERPQNVSFLFFTILIGFMDKADRNEHPTIWLFPLMLLWANCHGGFIVGGICLAIFALGYLVKSRFSRSGWTIFVWAFGGILISMVNPNGYHFYKIIFNTKISSTHFIQEFLPVWPHIMRYETYAIILVVMMLILVIGAVFKVNRSFPMFSVYLFIAAISLQYARNAPFFLLGIAPAVAFTITAIARKYYKHTNLTLTAGVAFGVLALTAAWGHPYNITRPSFSMPVASRFFPAKAARFIADVKLKGGMFNEYNWGGYLIWNLYPQQRVFIDGRNINQSVFNDYILIAKGSLSKTAQGKYLLIYAQLLNDYHVDVIIQANTQMQYGDIQPLMGRLLDDPTWIPVYLDQSAYIFVRNGSNKPTVDAYRIDKSDFLQRMEAMMRASSNIPAMADLLIYQNRLAEAEVLLTAENRRQPDNAMIEKRLAFIAQQRL